MSQSQNVPNPRRPLYKTYQASKRPMPQNVPNPKHPKSQNVPSLKNIPNPKHPTHPRLGDHIFQSC